MFTAGIDIGSSATKAVMLNDGEIVAMHIIPTGIDSVATGEEVYDGLLSKVRLRREDVSYVVATGYGRINVAFADKIITEISCHAKGLHKMLPDVRTILDMGGQDCKVIKLDADGKVETFIMNDKCAAGTGRYLERIGGILHVPLEQIGELSLQIIDKPAPVSSFCTVFAESDAVLMLRRGVAVNDILAGVSDGIVERVCKLIMRLGLDGKLAITGGIAQNCGITKRIEKKLDVEVLLPEKPQMIGALGAAMFAYDRAMK